MPGSAEDFGIWKKNSWLRFKLRTRKTIFGARWGEASLGLRDARVLVESESWDSSLEEGNRFLVSPRRDQLGSPKCATRLLKKLCLSLLMSKNLKLKKVIKSFVPESISCFSGFPMYVSHIYILVVFLDLYITFEREWWWYMRNFSSCSLGGLLPAGNPC